MELFIIAKMLVETAVVTVHIIDTVDHETEQIDGSGLYLAHYVVNVIVFCLFVHDVQDCAAGILPITSASLISLTAGVSITT